MQVKLKLPKLDDKINLVPINGIGYYLSYCIEYLFQYCSLEY